MSERKYEYVYQSGAWVRREVGKYQLQVPESLRWTFGANARYFKGRPGGDDVSLGPDRAALINEEDRAWWIPEAWRDWMWRGGHISVRVTEIRRRTRSGTTPTVYEYGAYMPALDETVWLELRES